MKSVLLVEDDSLIAMDICQELQDLGLNVKHASTVSAAFATFSEACPDGAILDMQIRSETTFEFALKLRAAGVPFFFLSGNSASALPAELSGSRIIGKPVDFRKLQDAVDSMFAE